MSGSTRVFRVGLGDQRGSESSLAGCEGYCEAFGFHIIEKEAAGSFEQGRDRLQFVF